MSHFKPAVPSTLPQGAPPLRIGMGMAMTGGLAAWREANLPIERAA